MTNGHGDDLHRYSNIRANFSSNVYASTDNASLLRHLSEHLAHCLRSYPEPEPYTLQALLAEYHSVSPDQLLVTSGATEAIYLTAHLLTGSSTYIAQPTFSEYASACSLYRHHLVDRTDEARYIWLCNPNNPTGTITDEVASPDQTLIIDRSYEYFARRPLPTVYPDRHIYIHSLTKRYAITGLRIGYIIGPKDMIERMRLLRQPWSVNALAIEAGRWIARTGFPDTLDREALWNETDRLGREISRLSGFCVHPTQTHYMIITAPIPASELKERLAHEFGLLIRDASNFPSLSPYDIRIATQCAEDNNLLIRALDKISSPTSSSSNHLNTQ